MHSRLTHSPSLRMVASQDDAAKHGTAPATATAANGHAPNGTSSAPGSGPSSATDFCTPQQRSLFALLNAYADVHLPARPYPTDADAPDPLMDAYLLHCLNHIAKTADRIKKNNASVAAAAAARAEGKETEGKEGEAEGGMPRDQGFTRPKVLLLLPQRNFAFRAVRRLVALAIKETRSDSVQVRGQGGRGMLKERGREPGFGDFWGGRVQRGGPGVWAGAVGCLWIACPVARTAPGVGGQGACEQLAGPPGCNRKGQRRRPN